MKHQHDTGYKKLFLNKIMVEELITSFVEEKWTKEIDFSTLQNIQKTFINDNFKRMESDIIYSVQYKEKDIYFYILLEFQSTVDKFMSLRFLRYITEFYFYLLENKSNKIKKLPAVFPILLYNGTEKWTSETNVSSLIQNSIPKKYIPTFNYYKIIENEIPKDKLMKIRNAVSTLFLVETTDIKGIKKEINKIVSIIKAEKPEVEKLITNWFKKIFTQSINDKKVIEKLNNITEVKSMLIETLEKRDKMIEEKALKQGLRQGMFSTEIEVAKRLIKRGVKDINEISIISGLEENEVKKLFKK